MAYLDIFRSAAVLIREHGAGATLEAAQRTDAMLERGDMDGAAVWRRANGLLIFFVYEPCPG